MQTRLATVAVLGAISPLAAGIEPANLQAGPVYIAPTLQVETRYTDNLFRAADDTESSWVLDTTPKVQAWLQNGPSTYSLTYQLQDFRYSDSSNDNFTDQRLNLDIHHEFNGKNVLDVNAGFYDGHEQRGTGLAEGSIADLIDEPVELEKTEYGAKYTFGNSTSRGRAQFGYQFSDIEYQNFREQTQYRDREADNLTGTLFWNVAPRTDLLAEVRYTDTAYQRDNPEDASGTLDSEEYNYYVGVSWEATAKTSGSVRVGAYDRQQKSRDRDDQDGFSWQVEVDYKPRTYSTLNFSTGRFTQETNGLGDSINTAEYRVSWGHEWNQRSSTLLSVLYGEDDYNNVSRDDERWGFEARYTYAFRRWFDLSGGYRFEKRDSNAPEDAGLDYDANMVFLRVDLSL